MSFRPQPQPWNNQLVALQAEVENPKRPNALKLGSYIALGQLHYDAGNYGLALEQYNAALQLRPTSIDALAGQADSLRHLKRDGEAIVAYDLAIARSPHRAELWANRGRSYEHLEQYSQAIADYEQALKLSPEHYQLWQRHADLLYRQERYGGAVISYARALAAQPLEDSEITSQCLFLDSPGPFVQRYQEAFEQLDRQLVLARQAQSGPVQAGSVIPLSDIRAAALWQTQGERLCKYRFWMEAIASFDHAIALRPHRAELHQKRAQALLRLSRPSEAEASYHQALALFVQQENLVGETDCRDAIAQLEQKRALATPPLPQPKPWQQLREQIRRIVGPVL